MTSKKLLCGLSIIALAQGACDNTSEGMEEQSLESQKLSAVRATVAEPLGKASPEDAAQIYATKQLPELGALASWKVRVSKVGKDGLRHVRLIQLHAGIPVLGGDLVVHLKGEKILSMSGNVIRGLGSLDTTAVIDANQARDAAHGAYLARVTDRTAKLTYDHEKTELVILPGHEARPARPVWRVSFHTLPQGGVEHGAWNHYYDAQTGELLEAHNDLARLSQASGPGGNAKAPRLWTSQLDVEPDGAGAYKMDTSRLRTFSAAGHWYGGGTMVVGPLNPIGDAPINDAHGFSEITLNMMQDWFGFNSIDDAGQVITSYVHSYVNAAPYDGGGWFLGEAYYADGGIDWYPASGDINIVAHEIHHGFTENHSGIQLVLLGSVEAMAVSESFSDIAGELAEAYHYNTTPDLNVGGNVMLTATALRFMCNPPADGISIDHYSNFNDPNDPNLVFNVHRNAGIGNKAFCLAAKRFASNSPNGAFTKESVLRAARAWYLANESYWTSTTTFAQACQGILDAAVALGFSNAEHEHLRQAWSSVGVSCGSPLKQHILFRDSSNNVRELYNDGSGWLVNNNLTAAASATPASTDPFGYSVGYRHRIVYRNASNGHIHELYENGVAWLTADLTPSSIGTNHRPMGYSVGLDAAVVFRGTDGNLRQLYNNGTGWVNSNLNSLASSTNYPAGKPFGIARDGKQYVVFRDSSNRVHEFVHNGTTWSATNLTSFMTTTAASDPMIYALGSTRHIIYKDSTGNVHELFFNGSFWNDNNLTTFLAGSPTASGDPFGYASGFSQHIVFRNGTNLHELYNNGSYWAHNNLTTIGGGTGPVADVMGYYSGNQHIVFRDSVSNHVREVFNSGFWTNNNLSALLGSPYPIGSVMGYTSL